MLKRGGKRGHYGFPRCSAVTYCSDQSGRWMHSLLGFSSISSAFASIVLSQGHRTAAEWPSPHHQFFCCQMTTVYHLLCQFTVCSVTSWLTKLPWSHPHNNMGFLVTFIQHWTEKILILNIYIYTYILMRPKYVVSDAHINSGRVSLKI